LRIGGSATGVLITDKGQVPGGDGLLSATHTNKARKKLTLGRNCWQDFLRHDDRLGDKTICRHPSKVPGFHGLAADRAFKAAYLASAGHGFDAVVNGAALT
jgi:hypothetical protein